MRIRRLQPSPMQRAGVRADARRAAAARRERAGAMTIARRARAPPRRQGRLEPRHQRRPRARPRRPSRAGPSEIAALTRAGKEVVLVSSGAIAEGMQRLGWTHAPVGDARAAGRRGRRPDGTRAGLRDRRSRKFGLHTAQILLTHDDLADRRALSQRALDAASRCSARRHSDHQRERHGDDRRDPLRRQRHAGRARHESDRSRRAGAAHRPAGTLHRRSAPRSRRNAACARRAPAIPRSKRWPAAPAARSAAAAC